MWAVLGQFNISNIYYFFHEAQWGQLGSGYFGEVFAGEQPQIHNREPEAVGSAAEASN